MAVITPNHSRAFLKYFLSTRPALLNNFYENWSSYARNYPEDTTNIGYQGYQNRVFSGHKPQTDLNAIHLEAIRSLTED
jgi:hypothetical protein